MIILNMIVKDEAHCIARCLRSVKPYIDRAIIVDTGSTDSTVAVVSQELQGKPFAIFSQPWSDFGYNRTSAFRLAQNYGNAVDFAFVIDADEEFRPDLGFAWPDLSHTSYAVWNTVDERSRYLRRHLFRLDMPWTYEGVVHEVAICPGAESKYTVLPGCTIHGHFDSARNKAGQAAKCAADAELLAKQPRTPRNVFYWAQSLLGSGDVVRAMMAFDYRGSMPNGDAEERWYALHMVGALMDRLGTYYYETVAVNYQRAINFRPSRAETYIALARYAYRNGEEAEARKWHARACLLPMTTDGLNVDISCYRSCQHR